MKWLCRSETRIGSCFGWFWPHISPDEDQARQRSCGSDSSAADWVVGKGNPPLVLSSFTCVTCEQRLH